MVKLLTRTGREKQKVNANGFDIYVSDLLEKETTNRQKKDGIDIADFFMKNLYN